MGDAVQSFAIPQNQVGTRSSHTALAGSPSGPDIRHSSQEPPGPSGVNHGGTGVVGLTSDLHDRHPPQVPPGSSGSDPEHHLRSGDWTEQPALLRILADCKAGNLSTLQATGQGMGVISGLEGSTKSEKEKIAVGFVEQHEQQ
jgi:hypothetical protein